MNAADHYLTRYLEAKDLDQYNALLRYTFQVTEEELTATGWKDDEIKQSKFPVLERADVLGCFDGDTLVSQFAVYPLKMNIYDTVYHVGFVTSVCTYPEYPAILRSECELQLVVCVFEVTLQNPSSFFNVISNGTILVVIDTMRL